MPQQLAQPADTTGRASRSYPHVLVRFAVASIGAMAWMVLSVWLSWAWLRDSADLIGVVPATLVLAAIAWAPGFVAAFLVVSLVLDRAPLPPVGQPTGPVTVVVAARDESARITETLSRIATQDYAGPVRVVVADNGSSDGTGERARMAAQEYGLSLRVVPEIAPGRPMALNTALVTVDTEYVVTLDADTLLHPTALRCLVSRMVAAPDEVAAVCGGVLVRNSRTNLWTRAQEWEYFLGIAAIKRVQAMYEGSLVIAGTFSVYRTRVLRAVGGWPDAVGADVVLSGELARAGSRVLYEPRAVAFTLVPDRVAGFGRQRARWARATVAGLRALPPWRGTGPMTRFLTGLDLLVPVLDLGYTLIWWPGLVLALFGQFWVVGPYAVFVLPVTLLANGVLHRDQQRRVFGPLGLRVRRNRSGLLFYVLCYQMVMSPVAVVGYAQELLGTRRA